MAINAVQSKLNSALTTNAAGDYALRTVIEGDQTVANLTATGILTLGANGGTSGQLNFIASDNDQANIAINTSDKLVFSGASGGYAFDFAVQAPDGQQAAPGITFAGDANTGMYRIGSDNFGLVTGGLLALSFNDVGAVPNIHVYGDLEFQQASEIRTTTGILTLNGVDGVTFTDAIVNMANLPTADPTAAGQLWSNSGVVTVSAG